MKVLLLIMAIVSVQSTPPALPRQAVTLDLSVPMVVSLHEPVALRLAVTNTSDAVVRANFGINRVNGFEFRLIRPDGTRQVVRPQPREGAVPPDEIVVEPRGTYRQLEVLDAWLDFQSVGTYNLQVHYSGSVVRAGTAVSVPRDYTFTVNILPRDPARLLARCQELATKLATHSQLADPADDPIKELSYVRDPVAVPFLEDALRREIGPDFCEPLARIGTPEAREALTRLSSHSQEWVRRCAAGALRRMK